MPSPQGRYWILTVPHHCFVPFLPVGIVWIKGQLELAASGFLHWQIVVAFSGTARLSRVRDTFGEAHAELCRSSAADAYVWKDLTAVANTRFELGTKSLNRACQKDWDAIWESAKAGRLDDIPRDVLVRNYRTIKQIGVDYVQPTQMERTCSVFWGRTGLGKSKLAWEEAGFSAYPKSPSTKFWDGYRGQEHVVLDEFRGDIGVSHLLRWLDRYPVIVEIKGSACVLQAKKIWITSNLSPREWYPLVDEDTLNALLRRLNVVHFDALQ